MFGLVHRGELPGTTESELEHLALRVQRLWLMEHNEDGSHRTEVMGLAAEEHTHDAADVTTGTFAVARIPDLDAAKITSGTFDAARIPDLDAAKITTGALDKARQHAQTAYLDTAQTFTAAQRINAGVGINIAAPGSAGQLALSDGIFERSRSVAIGEWVAVAHNGANYTASPGTWTVDSADQITLAYTLIGKTMIVSFTIAGTDIASSPTTLSILIPASATAARRMDGTCTISDAGATAVQGQCYVSASGTTINIEKNGGTAFTNTTSDNTNITGQIIFEIQ